MLENVGGVRGSVWETVGGVSRCRGSSTITGYFRGHPNSCKFCLGEQKAVQGIGGF